MEAAAIQRPSRVPAIHVPTSTRHAIPDPNAPFTSFASEPSLNQGRGLAGDDESEEEEEEEAMHRPGAAWQRDEGTHQHR